jgi:hypothetical protein
MFKLFGGKKKDKGYFLELDESKVAPAEAAKTEESAQPAEAQAEPEPAPVAAEAPAQPAPAKATQKTSAKKTAAKKTSKAAPAPVPAPAPKIQTTDDIIAAALRSAKNKPSELQEVTFATQHLITPPPSRRRPGPSLNAFKDMARQVKTPR